jgi:hypothetical protein
MDRIIAALLMFGWATGGLEGERKPRPVTLPAPATKVERASFPREPKLPDPPGNRR